MNPSDDRNVRPRTGSLLWWYVWTVVAAATAVTVMALSALGVHNLGLLPRSAQFWVAAGLLLAAALRPPTAPDGGGSFAIPVFLLPTLMCLGLPTAVVLCGPVLLARGALYRQALHRNLFNVAVHLLALAAAWGALRACSIDPGPAHPWRFGTPPVETNQVAAIVLCVLAYTVVTHGGVYVVLSISQGRSLARTAQDDLGYLVTVELAEYSLVPLVLVVMVHLWLFVPFFLPALMALHHNATRSLAHEHDALHDSLTGLGNRGLLHREGSKALEGLGRQDEGLAIFVLDLDKFKEVNDTLGHAAGDRLLQIVTERLLAAVRPDDLVARLGGDEFVVLVHDVPDTTVARIAAVRLIDRVNGTCQIDDTSITVAASLGVAVAPMHGVEFDALLRRADRAMYIAKSSGCGVAVFDPRRDDDWRRPPVVVAPRLRASGAAGR